MNGDAKQPEQPVKEEYKPSEVAPQAVAPAAPAPQPISDPAVVPNPAPSPAPMQQVAPLPPAPQQRPEVSWVAVEFIDHEKSILWYLALVAVTVGLALIVLIFSHDKVSTTLIIIIGIIFGITAGRKPRSLQYLLDGKGITINRAFRPYADFKSFAVIEEGALSSIVFMPLKRFTLPLSLYVSAEETDQVVWKLSDYLPNDQTHGHDGIDRFLQRIHF
jgi:hypothetical protein